MFEQIVTREESMIPTNKPAKTFIDLGANIWLTSIMFASRHPDVRVVAVDPDDDDFAILKRNIEPYPNIVAYQACIWHEATSLVLQNEGAEDYALRFGVCDGNRECAVEAITMKNIFARSDLQSPVITKVDIEGVKIELFSMGELTWIETIEVFAIEPHDRFRSGCTEAIHSALDPSH